MNPTGLAMLAAAATGIQVGLAIVATRFVVDQTTPVMLAFLRYLIGFLCLLVPLGFSGWVRFERRDLLPIGVLGILQFAVLIWLMNHALGFIPSARVALIFASTPMLTLVLAAIMGSESLGTNKVMGVALTMLGVAVALGEKALVREGGGWQGELAVLGSAVCGAVCSVLYRPYLRKYPTLQIGALAMLASVGFLLLMALGEGSLSRFPSLTPGGWGAVLFIGLSSGVGYFLWLWALNHTTPTRVTVFLALSPITSTVLGTLLLSEPLSWGLLLGLSSVVAGIVLSHR